MKQVWPQGLKNWRQESEKDPISRKTFIFFCSENIYFLLFKEQCKIRRSNSKSPMNFQTLLRKITFNKKCTYHSGDNH